LFHTPSRPDPRIWPLRSLALQRSSSTARTGGVMDLRRQLSAGGRLRVVPRWMFHAGQAFSAIAEFRARTRRALGRGEAERPHLPGARGLVSRVGRGCGVENLIWIWPASRSLRRRRRRPRGRPTGWMWTLTASEQSPHGPDGASCPKPASRRSTCGFCLQIRDQLGGPTGRTSRLTASRIGGSHRWSR